MALHFHPFAGYCDAYQSGTFLRSQCEACCVQVRKSYEEKRSRRRARGQKRAWRLKRMAMEVEDDNAPSAPGRGREQRGAPAGTRQEQDMERFMQACLLPRDLFITAACPMHVTSACLC